MALKPQGISRRIETKSFDAPQPFTLPRPSARYRARRTPADRLRRAIELLGKEHGVIMAHQETPWASVTFEGARHEFRIAFEGHLAVAAGEAFIEALPEHEFAIPGQLVADASIREVDHQFGASETLTIACVILLIKEA